MKSNAIIYPTTDKKKESNDHSKVTNYLNNLRSKKVKPQNGAGYVSNFTNYDDIQSDSA